jgi:hypothetical protein
MAKYIKLDDAIKILKSLVLDEDDENVTVECPNECNAMLIGNDGAVHHISNMPTIEIVQCKDCTRQDKDNVFNSMWCHEMRTFVKPNGFCSSAKRKES